MSSAVQRMRLRPRAFLAAVALTVLSAPAVPVSAATIGDTQTYIVLYRDGSSSSGAASVVQGAGGQLVANYSQIGVVIARSNRSDFAANVATARGVETAVATAKFATSLGEDKLAGTDATDSPVTTATPVSNTDTLTPLQWDMRQIHADQAHAVTGGSRSVVVGDIDTGLDFTHPDLAPNYDAADSANCISGAPTPLLVGNDGFGHGTHTAGTIAAAANGIGIEGVAPNVRIAGIKAGTDIGGFFFPEAVVCAFVWAGTHHINVTNNSYFADPWYFNCKNDAEQRAIWKAESRAINFAQSNGVLVVAAMGNFDDDLAHPTQDVISPDTGDGVPRRVTNACAVVPVEVSGVIGVAADGNLRIRSFYSNYGVGVTQVVAPGGDSILQRTAAAPNGRVLSTYPAALADNCARKVFDGAALYCYMQGTSMASPHVAGVAALIESQGTTNPGAVAARIANTANPIPCPADVSPWVPFPSTSNGAGPHCQGGAGYNSWYGHGEVDALAAIS